MYMEVNLQAFQSTALEYGKSPASIFGHFTEGIHNGHEL